MGPQRNSQAVFASWIDPHCKILPLINEDLDDTATSDAILLQQAARIVAEIAGQRLNQ